MCGIEVILLFDMFGYVCVVIVVMNVCYKWFMVEGNLDVVYEFLLVDKEDKI